MPEQCEAMGLTRVVVSDYSAMAREMIRQIDSEVHARNEAQILDWIDRITRRHWWQFWRHKQPTREHAYAAMASNWVSGHDWLYGGQRDRCCDVLKLCQASSDGYAWLSPRLISSVRGPSFGLSDSSVSAAVT